MKRILTIILFTQIVVSNAQVSSSCIVPPDLATEYHKDIIQLTTNYLFQISSPDTSLVHPPAAIVEEISGGMAAILNATSIPERDSVFNLYCIHNLNGWPFDYAGFLVKVDTSYSWTDAWQNLNTLTGNSYMDSLTSEYGLHVTQFYNWGIGNYAELSVDSAWNIMALMDSISYCPGVLSVEQNGLIGEAGWIEYHKSGSDRIFDFYFEFNDCFDGCDNYHRWIFKVDTNCNVYYLGFADWGVFGISPLPPALNCNLFTGINEITEDGIIVFPNPAGRKLAIGNRQLAITSITIYNLLGKLVLNPSFQNSSATQQTEIDVHSLSSGIYILEISDGEKSCRTRFIKN